MLHERKTKVFLNMCLDFDCRLFTIHEQAIISFAQFTVASIEDQLTSDFWGVSLSARGPETKT